MRVLVCGGRHFTDTALVYKTLDRLKKSRGVGVIIEGNARGVDRIAGYRGVDRIAGYWARRNKIENLKFSADWTAHGTAAGPIRNQRMIDEGKPDLVVALPGGAGTMDMVKRAHAAGIEVVEITVRP